MASPPEGDGRSTTEILGHDWEILGHERPLVRERWQALSRRARVTVAVTSGAVLLGGGLAYAAANRPPPAPPDPGAAATARITAMEMPHRTGPDLGVTFALDTTSRVTFVGLTEGYDNVFVREPPGLGPGTVLRPGRARLLRAGLDFYCAAPRVRRDTRLLFETPHPRPGLPLLFVIVRNARGESTTPVVPTSAQFDTITRAVDRACG
jgi:hypothetical protein